MRTTMPEDQLGTNGLKIARECDAYYSCQKDTDGKRLGPLVGYAGKYAEGKQFVGEEFINFAKIERFPEFVSSFIVPVLIERLDQYMRYGRKPLVFSAAPMGGIVLGSLLSVETGCQYGYPEKIELKPATSTSRAESALRYGRHEVTPGSSHIIVEDVCNNFSTTGDFIDEIRRLGGEVRAITCFLNRSPFVDDSFEHGGTTYPVVPFWRQVIPEYRQDDPYVQDDVEAGNVFWKPKDRWDELLMTK